ncbi:hypothetical protein BJ944DRAFT_260711 [Cunninghamella echinulata]|nr:hypothetical protein BJ944DRAFT_260711 [Cunninghamella echinulata]
MAKAKKNALTTKATKTTTANNTNNNNNNNSNTTASFPKLSTKKELQITELEPNQIYIIEDFFNKKECEQVINYFNTHLPPIPPNSLIPKSGEAFRSNDRQSLKSKELADILWRMGLSQLCVQQPDFFQASLPRKPCGLNSNIRIYRYQLGQKFEAHYDDSVKDDITGLWTDWTLLIYLNDDGLKGGETCFYKNHDDGNNQKQKKKKKKEPTPPIIIQPKQGLALLHRHGQHCLLHEALEVTQGVKWVLRSDVLIG